MVSVMIRAKGSKLCVEANQSEPYPKPCQNRIKNVSKSCQNRIETTKTLENSTKQDEANEPECPHVRH